MWIDKSMYEVGEDPAVVGPRELIFKNDSESVRIHLIRHWNNPDVWCLRFALFRMYAMDFKPGTPLDEIKDKALSLVRQEMEELMEEVKRLEAANKT